MIYLDTHLVLWLFGGSVDLISKKALQFIDENEVYISPIVELELQFLIESKNLNKSSSEIIEALHKEINLKVCTKDFYSIIRESLHLHWTRDPFDRLIVAHASLNNNVLLTKDSTIRVHYKKSVW